MASNHKLSDLLKGKRIVSTANRSDTLILGFDDGLLMTIRTTGSSNSASTGGVVVGVRQQETTLILDFESGASLSIPTAEASGCVMVRESHGVMEYAD